MGRLKSKEKFKKRAKELIEKHKTNNPFELCKKLGIQVIHKPFDGIMGIYAEIQSKKVIFINSNLDPLLQIIVCSHELGHSFQDFEEAVCMRKDYLFGTIKIENEANYFAATLIYSGLIAENLVNKRNKEMLRKLLDYL